MIYVFGDHELDTTLYEPAPPGAKLELRVFNVLAYLVQQRARRHTRGTWTSLPGFPRISDTLPNNCIGSAQSRGDSGQATCD
jgi:hypothetical protein